MHQIPKECSHRGWKAIVRFSSIAFELRVQISKALSAFHLSQDLQPVKSQTVSTERFRAGWTGRILPTHHRTAKLRPEQGVPRVAWPTVTAHLSCQEPDGESESHNHRQGRGQARWSFFPKPFLELLGKGSSIGATESRVLLPHNPLPSPASRLRARTRFGKDGVSTASSTSWISQYFFFPSFGPVPRGWGISSAAALPAAFALR